MKILTTKNRAILRELVATDFKVRYQGSILGYAWSLLRPLFVFVILYVVFTKFLPLGNDIPHYPVYLLLGIVLWNFFVEATNTSMTSIVGRGDLIKKINIPKYLVIISGVISALVNLSLNLIVVLVFTILSGVKPMESWLLLPAALFELTAVAICCGFVLSVLFVKFRDTVYVWEVATQAGFYATPILYPLTRVANHRLREVIMLNPVAQSIQDARWSFITHGTITSWRTLHSFWLAVPILIIVVIGLIAIPYFKSQAKYFAENI